jgi:hypothetical protein
MTRLGLPFAIRQDLGCLRCLERSSWLYDVTEAGSRVASRAGSPAPSSRVDNDRPLLGRYRETVRKTQGYIACMRQWYEMLVSRTASSSSCCGVALREMASADVTPRNLRMQGFDLVAKHIDLGTLPSEPRSEPQARVFRLVLSYFCSNHLTRDFTCFRVLVSL